MKSTSRYLLYFLLATIGFTNKVRAQNGNQDVSRLTPGEFAIPASPIFDMMRLTPSQINRTADIKDFKVDWSFRSWRLNPNLAIQSQPVWEMFYNRRDLKKYQAASPFMRKLASTDVSVGSVQDENNDRRVGFAIKFNLIKTKDPLLARDLYEDIGMKYKNEREELLNRLKELEKQLDTTSNVLAKPEIRNQIQAANDQLLTLNTRRNAEINERAKIYVSENWNATSVDVAIGRVYAYQTDSAGSFRTLRLNRNTAIAGWINGSVGLGRRWLLSGLIRNSWYEEELTFLVRNIATGQVVSQNAVAGNTLLSMGGNLRYGSPYFSFFVEFLYEKKALKTPVEALSKVFSAPIGAEVVANTVKWDIVRPNTLSFGGDWRLNRSVVLNYGMRCVFNKEWKMTSFIPVASIACMMR